MAGGRALKVAADNDMDCSTWKAYLGNAIAAASETYSVSCSCHHTQPSTEYIHTPKAVFYHLLLTPLPPLLAPFKTLTLERLTLALT